MKLHLAVFAFQAFTIAAETVNEFFIKTKEGDMTAMDYNIYNSLGILSDLSYLALNLILLYLLIFLSNPSNEKNLWDPIL